MQKPAVIFDMDGTLADCSHRLHFVKGPGKKNWKMFFAGSADDLPRPEIVRLALELSANNAILIASGRPEQLRKVTENWLLKYDVPYERIYLRKNDDMRPDGIVKSEMFPVMQKQGFAPWLSVDDRESAVSAWRVLGLCCLQCDQSNY